MILTLYAVLIGIALVLIIIGLSKPSESAQALIGFFFLFLLSFPLLGGELEYKTGLNETYIYGNNFTGYHWDYMNPLEGRPQDPTEGFLFHSLSRDVYTSFNSELSRRLGYYLAIASAVGFGGVLFSLGRTKWGKDDEE